MRVLVTGASGFLGRHLADLLAARGDRVTALALEPGPLSPAVRFVSADVRDMVRAYWLAAEKGEPGEVYNIASGEGITIRAMLDRLLALSSAKVSVEPDPARMRPSDVVVLLGDASKFRAATGWEPRIALERTLADTLDYWRAHYAARASRAGG